MKKILREAHKLTRKMKEKYPEIDYHTQLGLFISYLLEEENKVELRVKQWFIDKNFTPEERYAAGVSDLTIIKETEKAVFIEFASDFGKFNKWVPKSCLMTDEEIEIERQKEIERAKRFEEGKRKYNELIKFAKNNGVKYVRVGLRKETIINKIKDAGLEVPADLIA